MSTIHDELGKKIERLVTDHIEASRRAAESAVKRAFATASPGRRHGEAKRPGPKRGGKRRTPEEIATLGEQFYATVCARPGETMSVLSTDLGVTSRELHRSVTNLKTAGRIRSAGQKHMTRYFAMG
jgi:hypothetical protein